MERYRIYSGDAVRRIRFIKRSVNLFLPRRSGTCCSLRPYRASGATRSRKKAKEKIHEIEDKVRTLKSMQAALGNLIRECSEKGWVTDCPILDALEMEGEE